MRTKLRIANRDDWRCAFCCHVRTGTIILGILHLIWYILGLSIIAVVLVHPELLTKRNGDLIIMQNEASAETKDVHGYYDYQNDFSFFRERRKTYHDINVGLALTLCTFVITVLMIYGAVKGKPSYLMPFFCLQVFDFCIASLTMIGYFSYMPDVRQTIQDNPNFPCQKELLKLDAQVLSLVVLIVFVLLMMIKAYFIGVVWACYKYLTYRNAEENIVMEYINSDAQVLLLSPEYKSSPPDYAEVTKDPKLAPLHGSSVPPPPYTPQDETV